MSRHRRNTYADCSLLKKSPYLENGKISGKLLSKLDVTEKRLFAEICHFATGINKSSDSSIYTGYCGIALLYFLKYTSSKDSTYLREALRLAESGVSNLGRKGRISFLNGDPGPLALAAVLHRANQQEQLSNQNISRLLSLDYGNAVHPDEVLYGRAGYLYSLLFVEKNIPGSISPDHFKKVIARILSSGRNLSKQLKASSPLYYMWHEKTYLGAAHGIAGILYLLLSKEELLSGEERSSVKETLDWLTSETHHSGNPRSSEGSASDRLIQWCHGAPGFPHLYLAAHKVFKNEKYLRLAEKMGEVVWERGLLEKGYSICHGVSGNAYTFLALYKYTKEEKHLHRAACFADYCTNHPAHQGHLPDRPFSLFEGMSGVAYILNDIKNPMNSAFPAFEI